MTQITFTARERVTASRLNQATQGYKFLRRVTFAGSGGSPTSDLSFEAATWIPGSGTSALYVRVCGGGGGTHVARAGHISGASHGASAGAGGGGYAELWVLSGIGSNQQVGIGLGGRAGVGTTGPGAGGKSFFGPVNGPIVLATGGSPGSLYSNVPGNQNQFVLGGAAGIGSGGNINAAGSAGGPALLMFNGAFAISGRGGQSAFGGPGGAEIQGVGFTSIRGGLYGGGAGGAAASQLTGVNSINNPGAPGAPGFVIIDEYG